MQNGKTPTRRSKSQNAKTVPTPVRGPSERLSKGPKTSSLANVGSQKSASKTSPKGKKSPIVKESDVPPSTPPKPSPSGMKLSISNSEISLNEQKSALDALNTTTSSESSINSQSDTLDKLSEITSDDVDVGVSKIDIPDEIRKEAGQNWRLKEAILNSFHFGKNSIQSHEFARSDSDKKTAEVLASSDHTLESKKYRVKLHLGRFSDFSEIFSEIVKFLVLVLS